MGDAGEFSSNASSGESMHRLVYLTGCGQTLLGYLVHRVCLMQPNNPDRTDALDRPNNGLHTLANFFRILLMSASACMIALTTASAEDVPQIQRHQADSASQERPCTPAIQGPGSHEGLESVQVEASDIKRHEQFFEAVLHAPVVQSLDHPQVDSLRGYCYRGVLIVVRQDLRTPRPTGWVQINFMVSDVAALQGELEQAYRASPVYQLSEEDRAKIVRFRLKPDVMRGDRRVIRLEVAGPEGFMIGFDQSK